MLLTEIEAVVIFILKQGNADRIFCFQRQIFIWCHVAGAKQAQVKLWTLFMINANSERRNVCKTHATCESKYWKYPFFPGSPTGEEGDFSITWQQREENFRLQQQPAPRLSTHRCLTRFACDWKLMPTHCSNANGCPAAQWWQLTR